MMVIIIAISVNRYCKHFLIQNCRFFSVNYLNLRLFRITKGDNNYLIEMFCKQFNVVVCYINYSLDILFSC